MTSEDEETVHQQCNSGPCTTPVRELALRHREGLAHGQAKTLTIAEAMSYVMDSGGGADYHPENEGAAHARGAVHLLDELHRRRTSEPVDRAEASGAKGTGGESAESVADSSNVYDLLVATIKALDRATVFDSSAVESAAVENALTVADRAEYGQNGDHFIDALETLAAEVRRLREVVASDKDCEWEPGHRCGECAACQSSFIQILRYERDSAEEALTTSRATCHQLREQGEKTRVMHAVVACDRDHLRNRRDELEPEVARLREELKRETERLNGAANGWNAKACELEREARGLREENARLTRTCEAQQDLSRYACESDYRCGKRGPCRVHMEMLGPRYSTEAVDALLGAAKQLSACCYAEELRDDTWSAQGKVEAAIAAVRDSREPK